MTYIDKRALATKKSPTSLIPYVSLDNIINAIIAPILSWYNSGATGIFQSADGKEVTVVNGLITSII
jgi:hypothetical protein